MRDSKDSRVMAKDKYLAAHGVDTMAPVDVHKQNNICNMYIYLHIQIHIIMHV